MILGSTEPEYMHDLDSCAARDAGSLVLQPRGCVTSLLPKGPLLCARFKKSAIYKPKSSDTLYRESTP